MATNHRLCNQRTRFGYDLVFKEVVQGRGHDPKGNVDAHLVPWAMKELGRYDQAVIVSGDGDYYPLVDHLVASAKLFAVIAPNRKYCSRLLRRPAGGTLRYIEDARHLVERTV